MSAQRQNLTLPSNFNRQKYGRFIKAVNSFIGTDDGWKSTFKTLSRSLFVILEQNNVFDLPNFRYVNNEDKIVVTLSQIYYHLGVIMIDFIDSQN